MPLYRYECKSCGNQFTVLVRQQAQADDSVCPKCGSEDTRRMVSRVAIQFKGSGYYKTDYAHKGKAGSAGTRNNGSAEAESSTDSKVNSAGNDTKPSNAASEKRSEGKATKETVSAG